MTADPPTLEISLIMDSSVGDVFAFKTCCGLKADDQNLEIQLKNTSNGAVNIPSRMELIGPGETKIVDNLMPHGLLKIAPGEIKAFYCQMDPVQWGAARAVVFFDDAGNRYTTPIAHATGKQGENPEC